MLRQFDSSKRPGQAVIKPFLVVVKVGQTVFGKDTSSIIDKEFKQQNKNNPGPGKYNRFSDFAGI